MNLDTKQNKGHFVDAAFFGLRQTSLVFDLHRRWNINRSNKAAVQATNDDASANKLKSAKGTVTSLSSIFSPEDAQRAARHVEETIAERRDELDCVQSFVEDNSSLVKLVQRLPDRLHHDIMVPFGKGAFFPGKLIHTNEFLVLLGEGYYADRTSKQTVEILNRRGKELESQVESLKAMIKDLKAEASFFNDTATEAAEGLVEIMEEDYVDEIRDDEAFSKAPMQGYSGLFENESINLSKTDEEFSRMMAKMDELEEAEIAAESENGDGERLVSLNELGKAERDEVSNRHSSDPDDEMNMKGRSFHNIKSRKSKVSQVQSRNPLRHDLTSSEKFQNEKTAYELFLHGDQKPHDKFENSKRQPEASATRTAPRGEILLRKDLTRDSGSSNTQKAFTGSIVEHAYNLEPKNQTGTSSQSATSLPSKPVSRFKMQRK